MKKSFRGNMLLLITAFIWGTAFVAQISGMDYLGPFTFLLARNIVAGLFLLIVIQLMPKITKQPKVKEVGEEKSTLIKGGIACGVALFVAMSFQQVGIQYTTAGKAGFITALYIVLVPLLGIFLGKKASLKIWICVIIAAVGLYLLSITEGFSIGLGDSLVLICALCFAVHILVVDHFSPKVDGVKMSCIQFFVVAVLSFVVAVVREKIDIQAIFAAAIPVLYTGVMSSGVGFTLQIVAQKDTNPTIASLIMSLESVFSVLAGALLLGERLTTRELIGCIIMFAAIIFAQIPDKLERNVS